MNPYQQLYQWAKDKHDYWDGQYRMERTDERSGEYAEGRALSFDEALIVIRDLATEAGLPYEPEA